MRFGEPALNEFVQSVPCPVRWCGFESDTRRLQNAGWRFSARQDLRYGDLRLAMDHQEARAQGISYTRFSFSELMRAAYEPGAMARYLAQTGFDMHIARDLHMVVDEELPARGFTAVDMEPRVMERRRVSLTDFAPFAPALARTQEIIVTPDQVPGLMEKILAAQAPGQAELRERARKRQRRDALDIGPEQVFHAQIVTLAEAA